MPSTSDRVAVRIYSENEVRRSERECEEDHFVYLYGSYVREAEEAVVGVDGSIAKGTRIKYAFIGHGRSALVAVNDVHALANENVTEEWQEGNKRRQYNLIVTHLQRQVVHF